MSHPLRDTITARPLHAEETEECVHRLFEAQAARRPDDAAVIHGGAALSYGALNRRSNRLARRLRAVGIGPESLVGVQAPGTGETVVALLAILKAGGAYLPLDPTYPPARLAFMLADARASAVLTQGGNVNLSGYEGPVLSLDDEATFDADSDADLSGDAGVDGLAYVIYTSGSTGTPKGVEIAHRGVCNNLRWRQETFTLGPQDRLLQTYSFSFDPSVWAVFWPLICGAAVVLPPAGASGDPAALVETIWGERVSVLGFSPSMLRVLLENPGIAACRSLRHVFSGGEPLTPGLAARFFDRLPQALLHNVYGPTEATIDATWWTCRPEDGEASVVPIGRALPRTEMYVLGEGGQPVPPGVAGELHIAGVGLARGYRGRPELTAERFIPNPMDTEDFPTLYRTGDLCRRRGDGAVEYLGRLDGQVKVRGFRVETGEVEAVLSRHPGVRAAAVTVRERGGDRQLAAYVVPHADAPSRQSLRRHAEEALPAHMVPGSFVLMDALPLSPTGKVDRGALPAPAEADWARADVRVPARTPQERQLVALFEELLGVRPLGIRDDFFEWGGHSLLAARLVAVVERLTGRRLALPDLAASATVERLASLLAAQESAADPGLGTPEGQTALPLLQRWSSGPARPFFFCHGSFTGGLWCAELAQQLGPERPLYSLSPHGADGGAIPATVEAMAAEYVETIRAAQPEGPYLLGGFCNGGLVAYEVARQLRNAGEEVATLILIEIILAPTLCKLWLHGAAGGAGRRLGLGAEARSRLSLALQSGSASVLAALQTLKWGVERRVLRVESRKSAAGFDWSPLIPEPYRKTAVSYHLRPYEGRVTIVSALDSVARTRSRLERRWRELLPDVTFATVPGAHFDCLHKHLPDVAAHLRSCLDAADASAPVK